MDIPYTSVLPNTTAPLYDLTIVTVCRNALAALKRTTASVLGQKAVYPSVSIEHVIVDGASTDGTPEWLAEMKEQGKIEAYISEPDRGIYDAMNKGINMARGAAIIFINADDTLELVDLADCVTPIVKGETKLVGATTRLLEDSASVLKFYYPDERLVYLYGPVHHQAFFAQTQFLREIGGYNSKEFRCMADTDLICKAVAKVGFPYVVEQTVSSMPAGGFSCGGFYRFCDEYINIMYSFREKIADKCRNSKEYHQFITASLLNHCISMQFMLKKEPAIETRMLEQMRELAAMALGTPGSFLEKMILRYINRAYVPAYLRSGRISARHKFCCRLYARLYKIPRTHPYGGLLRVRHTSLLATARLLFNR